jgi:hypothetical protein
MTLEELEATLPNGLHDAEVKSVLIDYVERRATMELSVWVGDMSDLPATREAYKDGSLTISGLLFVAVEPPDPNYPFAKSGRLCVDACDMKHSLNPKLLTKLPAGAFVRSLFVNGWNSFFHFAGLKAEISWKDGGEAVH